MKWSSSQNINDDDDVLSLLIVVSLLSSPIIPHKHSTSYTDHRQTTKITMTTTTPTQIISTTNETWQTNKQICYFEKIQWFLVAMPPIWFDFFILFHFVVVVSMQIENDDDQDTKKWYRILFKNKQTNTGLNEMMIVMDD